jgi:hypothetical protein
MMGGVSPGRTPGPVVSGQVGDGLSVGDPDRELELEFVDELGAEDGLGDGAVEPTGVGPGSLLLEHPAVSRPTTAAIRRNRIAMPRYCQNRTNPRTGRDRPCGQRTRKPANYPRRATLYGAA